MIAVIVLIGHVGPPGPHDGDDLHQAVQHRQCVPPMPAHQACHEERAYEQRDDHNDDTCHDRRHRDPIRADGRPDRNPTESHRPHRPLTAARHRLDHPSRYASCGPCSLDQHDQPGRASTSSEGLIRFDPQEALAESDVEAEPLYEDQAVAMKIGHSAVAAPRKPTSETRRRALRLERLLESQQDERVREALRDVHDRHKPEVVRIRPPFVVREEVTDPPPPNAALISPNGQATRWYLTALFVAACASSAKRSGPFRNTRPLNRAASNDPPGWSDLLAVPARAAGVKERSGPRTNRLRQIKSALDTLAKQNLVTLGSRHARDRYEEFVLHPETGPGQYADPVVYHVPVAGEAFPVPINFFLNGWLWALTNSELAAYLMFRYLAWNYGTAHRALGVYVTGGDREDLFDLNRDVYEGHLALARYGLLVCHPAGGRGTLGKWPGYVPGGRLEPHRFQLHDSGIDEPAIERVLGELE